MTSACDDFQMDNEISGTVTSLYPIPLVPNLWPFGSYCAALGAFADSSLCFLYVGAYSNHGRNNIL